MILFRSCDDKTKGENDDLKCVNYQESEFRFYCKACNEHLCIEWFCKTCRYSICEQCYKNGDHKQHDVVLCRTMADDQKSEVNKRYIEVAENKKEPIIHTLETLEAVLYDIGVEGVKTFKTTHNDDNTNHVSSLERAKNDVRAHYAAIRHLAIEMEEMHLLQIDVLAKTKSDAVMTHIKALHADLDHIDICCDAKEAIIASPALEACASHSNVMALLDDLEAHMASIKITMDSSIQVTLRTSDVLRVLEKSCHVGGPSTPGEVLIEVAENQSGFVVSWNISEVDEGKSKVSSYEVEVKIVRKGENETITEDYIPHKYTVMASTSSSLSSSPASDSNRLRYKIKDKVFEGQKVYAMVTATDMNGACSGKGVSASVVLPDRFGLSFQYESDFDQNGLLFYIGSAGGTRGYMNPHVSGDVVVTWSSIASNCRVEYFVNNQFNNEYSHTTDVPGSWMMVDLGATRRISPKYYSLRHDYCGGGFLRNWVLEGKMDDSDTSAWVVLREHVDDTAITGRGGATCSWPVTNVGVNQCYRYIRIRMTGVDSGGTHFLLCSGMELYGNLHISL
jgi:hypothetical protein